MVLLLDCRIPPQDLDMELASFVQASGIPILPVLTKIDKCNQRERSARENEWKIILWVERLFMVSAKTGFGVDGNEKDKELDFEMVRGEFEKNNFAQTIKEHIQKKTALAQRVSEQIKKIV